MTQFDMNFEPWIVGDIATVALADQILEEKVDDFINECYYLYGESIEVDSLERMMRQHGLNFEKLPYYLQERIDHSFDVR